jgi:hypothetical protein
MAIKLNWKIVSNKDIKKIKKPKPINKKSLLSMEVYWLEWPRYSLWVWFIVNDMWDKIVVDCLNRDLRINPEQNRTIREINFNKVTLKK